MAAGIFEALSGDSGLPFEARSAGTAALVGEPAAPEALRAMEELGIDISAHRARQVDRAAIMASDLVLAMTPRHRETLHKNFEEYRARIHTLPEFAAGETGGGIADPYGYPFGVYRSSAREILRYVEALLKRLERERDPDGPPEP